MSFTARRKGKKIPNYELYNRGNIASFTSKPIFFCSIIRCYNIARDVIAVSSVASEAFFSIGGRILDFFRTSLATKMVEALVCTQDWLRNSRTSLVVEDLLQDMKNIEESMGELALEQPEIIIDETDS